jgi:hypothetical protein
MRSTADLDGPYPPAIACHHAVTDDVAAVVIVIGIVVIIGVGPNTKSDEPTTMKPAVEAVEAATAEAAMDAGTAEAASAAATHDSVTAHAATATATAASQRRRRLNQTYRGQCEQSHHQFARHVSLHPEKSPVKHGTPSRPNYFGEKEACAVN